MSSASMPNFIIFGAMKAGSTSLCNYLRQHPDVYISPKKEPNYFLPPDSFDITQPKRIKTLEAYQHFFQRSPAKVQDEKAIGEASVSYLCHEQSPRLIRAAIPDVKLIAVLRNPVSRAYSHYLFLRRKELETAATFAEALEADENRPQPFGYFQKGLYGHYLQNYFSCFERSQIRIYLFDDFKQDTLALTQDIFRFLEVDPSFAPETSAKDAVSGIPHNQTLYNFIHQPHPLKSAIKPFIQPFFSAEKRRALWTKAVEASLSKPKLETDVKQRLRQRYRKDILQLQALIDRDLSGWL
ncbi:sulfotransferase domain-containing protein [Sphaerothrix gracilis]|uniref:sulfotransferase domain-containing protein n=1 Tax=Sphaerothrix gracilis TaxID=3151835 RepID=UPI0031FE105A